MKRRTCVQLGAASALSLQSFWLQAQQAPRRHALLVGVSGLLHQPQQFWLKGPVHDVGLMQKALLRHGFLQDDIAVLADDASPQPAALNGAQMPARATILQALSELSYRARAADVVMLYWSGHAVRAPGPRKAAQEADGRSTFLLASDAVRQPVAAHGWPLGGAVADAELGAAIDDLLAKGAHVFAVMDVCHASSTTRSVEEGVLWRGLRVSELSELEESPSPAGMPTKGTLPAVLPAARPRPHGYVGLYACEDMQRTPEWTLNGQAQGVFTYALAQALLGTADAQSYASLAQRTLDLHAQLARTGPVARSQWPSPVFEGSLQAPLWRRERMASWQRMPAKTQEASSWSLPQGVKLLLIAQEPGKTAVSLNLAAQVSAGGLQTLGSMPVGTRFELQLINAATQALYVRIFHVDSQGRWHALYPERAADAAMLPQGLPGRPARWKKSFFINQAESQPESLVWVVAEADPRSWISDASAVLPSRFWRAELSWRSIKERLAHRP